ncbi:hypothetical protein [Bremerella cremea]|uniref:hypothetical protein n=1 Tax=Bremerella cremea TaxID=1031537 RepID=UPI0018F3FA42|nr:hypothetical protein [Bremerella cremea]
MALPLRIVNLMLVSALATVAGCRLASSAPDPHWLADFQKADGIMIKTNHGQRTIAHPDAVARLERIYAEAKWKPYRDTLPGNLGQQKIVLLDGKADLRHFSYTGALWESTSYTEQRTAALSEEDRKWLEFLFAMIPQKDKAESAESRDEPSEKDAF